MVKRKRHRDSHRVEGAPMGIAFCNLLPALKSHDLTLIVLGADRHRCAPVPIE